MYDMTGELFGDPDFDDFLVFTIRRLNEEGALKLYH